MDMPGTLSIELSGLRFFAAHGVYEEEAKLGNEFEVNLVLTYEAPEKIITALEQTINYVAVYAIVQEEMNERKLLLETCAMQIAERLHQQFQSLKTIAISIKKIAPPIAGFIGSVGVTYTKVF